MTCAGIGAMVMARDVLDEGDARVDGDQVKCCQPHEADDRSIGRWTGWDGHFSVRVNPGDDPPRFLLYYLYGLEPHRPADEPALYRPARLVSRRGRLADQHSRKRFPAFGKGPGWARRFAYRHQPGDLFLAKGRRPVVAAKIKHRPAGRLESSSQGSGEPGRYTEKLAARSDVASDRRRRRHERRLDRGAGPVPQRQAGAESDDDVAKLREYVNRGGFIFADATCEGAEFDRGFRVLIDRMFPEPDHRLHLLPPEHAVWSSEEPVDPRYVGRCGGSTSAAAPA